MSRSYKKPYFTQQQKGHTKVVKRLANRTVRALTLDSTPKNGKAYCKEFCSWNIRDYTFHCPNNKKAYRK